MAIGNRVTPVPPHRSGRAAFPHPAPTSDNDGKALRPSVRAPASVTRFPGSVSGACAAGSHSPWPPPFAPSPPLPVPRFCSATSSLLWRGLTHMGAFVKRCHFIFLNSSWLYWHPGLSLVLDLVVSQPVPTHIRSPFSATAAPKSRFRRAKAQEDETLLLIGD